MIILALTKKFSTMKRTLIISISLIVVAFIGLMGFMSLKNDKSGGQASDENPAALNYRTYCAGCHGDKLEKFTAKKWMDEHGLATVINSIKMGIEAEGMPSFQNTFSEAETEELAAFVKKGIPEDRSSLKPAVKAGDVMESEVQDFIVETVVTGLDVPWGLVFLPDGDLLISERAGTLHRFSKGKLSLPIQGLPPVRAKGQGGLLDLCLHPDYAENGWIYFAYSALNPEKGNSISNTAIMRARLEGNKLVDQQVIFKGEPDTDRSHHYGCKLAFDNKGHLFFGIGDRGQHFDFPQKLGNANGKIHRINDDGSIPKDNPFVNIKGTIPSIYSYGHRNPQGTSIHPLTGELWASEHGPKGGDELNLIEPGKNYGWPVISYGINYNGTILTELTEKEGMEQPVYYWTPSIAPCGMTFLAGDKYKKWQNNLFIGSLRFQYLERVVVNGHSVSHTEKLLQGIGRVRNVVIGPDELIYVATETPGKIIRLVPVPKE
jgi:glucose/arabinose dehydrogenase